jgi:ornithine carbamoyltransferase
MHICALLGLTFAIAAPKGFELDRQVVSRGRELADKYGGDILETRDPVEAVSEADVVYTDVWTSMGQDAEDELRKKVFPPYQINEDLLTKAKPDVLVMHDLPAHRGEEITDAVADGPNSVIFPQAHNRLHAQKAILAQLLTS